MRFPARHQLWVTAVLFMTANSTARGASFVPIEIHGCDTEYFSQRVFEESLQLELNLAHEDVRTFVQTTHGALRVKCNESSLHVHLVARGDTFFEDTIPLGPGLERFVAIGITEAITAHTSSSNGPEAPSPPDPPPASPPVKAQETSPPGGVPLWLKLQGGARLGGTPGLWAPQVALGLDIALTPQVLLGADLDSAFLSVAAPPGPVHAYLLGLGLWAKLQALWEPVVVQAGLGLKGGAVVWSAASQTPQVVGGETASPWLSAVACLGGGLELHPGLRGFLELEGGIPFVTVVASYREQPLVKLDPAWVSLRAGLSWML